MNTKAYSKGTGQDLEALVEACVDKAGSKDLVFSVQPQDILRLEDKSVEVYAQHLDSVKPGSHTGSILGKSLKDAGATGTLINHSEDREPKKDIEKAVEKAEELGFTSIVCAQSPEECRELKEFNPDYIAFEPPELIGGDVSVTEAEPEIIEDAVEAASPVDTLTGAGIHNRDDVDKSVELGCKGVLVASGVVKAEKPGEVAKDLVEGL